jgi:3-oxoacyl-[acyl-carrier protein] reductase
METTNISQRVAAISGAASGIGLALATLYARRGTGDRRLLPGRSA